MLEYHTQLTIQILTVLSVQAVARNLPLGENWTRKTGAVWVRVMTSAFWIWLLDKDCQQNTVKMGNVKKTIMFHFLHLAIENNLSIHLLYKFYVHM